MAPESSRASDMHAVANTTNNPGGTPDLPQIQSPQTTAHADVVLPSQHTDEGMDIDPIIQQSENTSIEDPRMDNTHAMIINEASNIEGWPRAEPHAHTPAPTPEPPQLFNLRQDGIAACYTRNRHGKYIVYKHATAGARVVNARGTGGVSWRDLHEEIEEKYDRNLFGMWGS
ncbi:hypothetical protein RSAG8_03557, partial [Rhizoctonia solani AG-8 WAC10335]